MRADLDTSLCIQGAPGTGKTAVGLHRAAYLLYSYPERLRRSGVLVVGPNAAFLRYIAAGAAGARRERHPAEHRRRAGVEHRRPAGPTRCRWRSSRATPGWPSCCAGRCSATSPSRPRTWCRSSAPAGTGSRWSGSAATSTTRAAAMAAGELRWDSARERLRQLLAQDVRRQREDAGGAPSDAETAKVARSAQVREFLDAVWPVLDPRAVLLRLFTDDGLRPPLRRRPAERGRAAAAAPDAAVPAGAGAARPPFSAADLVLLDELAGLITGVEGFVHVVVDEAQDLSPMQCRAVARRCPLGSLTVLGDLAQATTPWAAGSWPAGADPPGPPGGRDPAADHRLPGARRGARGGQPAAAAHRVGRAAGVLGPGRRGRAQLRRRPGRPRSGAAWRSRARSR